MQRSSKKQDRSAQPVEVRRTAVIRKSADELYAFWRDLRNLQELLPDAVSVTPKSRRVSRWSVRAPGGKHLTWDTEIVEDRPGEVIAWESCSGADVRNSGAVRFERVRDRPDATKVELQINYTPPGGLLGAAMGRALRGRAGKEMAGGLRRVKQRLEAETKRAP